MTKSIWSRPHNSFPVLDKGNIIQIGSSDFYIITKDYDGNLFTVSLKSFKLIPGNQIGDNWISYGTSFFIDKVWASLKDFYAETVNL